MKIKTRLLTLETLAVLLIICAAILPLLANYRWGNGLTVALFIIALSIIILGVLTGTVAASIVGPLKHIVAAANKLSVGNYDVKLRRTLNKGELGQLEHAIANTARVQENFLNDLITLASHHTLGETSMQLDEDAYEGALKTAAEQINDILQGYGQVIDDFSAYMVKLSDGKTSERVKKYSGDFDYLASAYKRLQRTVGDMAHEASAALGAFVTGDVHMRIDVDKYQGELFDMAHTINYTLDSISGQITNTANVLESMVGGEFLESASGEAGDGEFKPLKEATDRVLWRYRTYGADITRFLNELASSRLNSPLNEVYRGELADIATASESILSNWKNIVTQMNNTATELNSDAGKLSNIAQSIVQTADKQSDFARELDGTMGLVKSQINENADNANRAAGLTSQIMANVQSSKVEMDQMISAIAGIKESSENIADITQVVDAIARQTNLLALNASVEAARAGVHGKGFKVVADEVRLLAAKSKEAAERTADMVRDSIGRVGEGTDVALNAATTLTQMVAEVDEINTLVSQIANTASQQSVYMNKAAEHATSITDAVKHITRSVEKAVNTSNNLNTQSAVLWDMYDNFETSPIMDGFLSLDAFDIPMPVAEPYVPEFEAPDLSDYTPKEKPPLPPIITKFSREPVPSGEDEYDREDFGKY